MNKALAILYSADSAEEPQVYEHPRLQFCIKAIRCRHTTKKQGLQPPGAASPQRWLLLSAPAAQDSLKGYLELPSHVSSLYRIQPHRIGPGSQAEDHSLFAVPLLVERPLPPLPVQTARPAHQVVHLNKDLTL